MARIKRETRRWTSEEIQEDMEYVRKSRAWARKNCGDWGPNPEGIEYSTSMRIKANREKFR